MIELKAYAGLIRNHVELADELDVDVSRLSRGEREEKLLVSAWERWGKDMCSHINGQFGFAIYDDATDTLFCARDPLGAELFFYYVTADGNLLFGTQIKDLFGQPGFVRELNRDMIQFYLGFTYVPGEETLFAGVRKLEPGGFLTFDDNGLQLGRYWELTFKPDESKTLEDWADEISDVMDKSLRDICDDDEQPDSFLSGGVDSSYILAKSRAKCGFCVAYEEQESSEEDDARATADHLGRGFEGITVSREDFFEDVDEFLLAYEQPSADVAGLALYSACKRVAEKSTLCFSGEGADEFFAGYSVYQSVGKLSRKHDPVYFGTTYIMNDAEQRRYLKDFRAERSARDFMRDLGAKGLEYDPLSWMLYVDLRSYFEGSILFNSTKISRGTGLDIRMPYCDLRMFDIACRMPSRFKAGNDGNKIALRAAASRVLPKEVAYRRKLGFPVPVRKWLADPSVNSDIRRAFESETAAEFFNVDEIGALLDALMGMKPRVHHPIWFGRRKDNLWRYVWTIYLFIRWYELFFLDGRKTGEAPTEQKVEHPVRESLAIGVCKASYRVMRMMGRTARAMPGKLALMVDGNIVQELSRGHDTVVITGTNGKTTTTHMVQQAIINAYGSAAYDPSSTNMEQGVATTLCLDSTIGGQRKSNWAVIESDEGATKKFLPAMLPKVLVVTNLYRDQVDRYPTWTTARDYIIEAIKGSPDTVLVLDADCQVTASIAKYVPNKVVWYGMECDAYDEGVADHDDVVECIMCGHPLNFSHRTFAHLGDFSCPNCGFAHTEPDIAVTAIDGKQEKSCVLTIRVHDISIELPVNIRAGYDAYNAVAALAGLLTLGVPSGAIAEALGNFVHAAHRFEIFDVEGTQTRLLLMKNTAGCNQLINMLVSEDDPPENLVCMLGNEIMDGLSTDWIQGVHWEKLITPQTKIIVGGPCYRDMRDRLLRAGADEESITVQLDYAQLVRDIAAMDEPVTVIANCSTIEALRLELVKRYEPMDYWAD